MFFQFMLIIVAGMFLVVLYENITLYVCEKIIILYPVNWLILYLLRPVWCFFPLWIILVSMFVVVFTRNDYFVWLWNAFFLIFSLLIGSLLAQFCMLFHSIWILNFCSEYVLGCFYKKWLLCLIMKWILTYI